MRAPSQVRLESADEYRVRRPFQVDGIRYGIGVAIPGDLARTWPTFRSLVDGWLIPVFDVSETSPAQPSPIPAPAARRRRSK